MPASSARGTDTCDKAWLFHVDIEDPNSDSHTCMTGTFDCAISPAPTHTFKGQLKEIGHKDQIKVKLNVTFTLFVLIFLIIH